MRIRRSLEAQPIRERREEMLAEEQSRREEEAEDGRRAYERWRDAVLEAQAAEERNLHEREEAQRLHDQDPGRFPSWASPRRMRQARERDREDEMGLR